MYNPRMPVKKFYVVWKGRKTGVFASWAECERQVKGFAGAQFMAFEGEAAADAAFLAGHEAHKGRPASHGKWRTAPVRPRLPSICVDAACSGSPGRVEFRGVDTDSAAQIFHAGPFEQGTNNVGEFLAIVQALTWQEKHGSRVPIYSDSENAIAWVENGICRTNLKHGPRNARLFALIHSAENWLVENELPDGRILKWDTHAWGENPADFGRK